MSRRHATMPDMFKRALAAFLWIWAGSALDGLLGYTTGLSVPLGLALGLLIAGVVVIDPRHAIWNRKLSKSANQEPARA